MLLVFNRPGSTARVFEAIRQARPPRLYIAADGPRATHCGEAERCAEVRRIATAVDWPSEVHTLFRDSNLGCKLGVSSAIDWFFQHEEEGIVLEDDVLPVPGFFRFCDELLERYRDEPRVGAISGCNLSADRYTPDTSYAFTRHNHVWGWASWRRAWRHYDVEMKSWPAWAAGGSLLRACDGNACAADYWRAIFSRAHAGQTNSWAYPWLFTCWQQNLLTALPARNLVTNLGLSADATHPVGKVPRFVADNPARELTLPLLHPDGVEQDARADLAIRRYVTGLSPLRCLKRTPARWLRRALSRN